MTYQMAKDPDGMDFTCIAGDLVNWNDMISDWATIFHKKGYGKFSATIPWMNVPGNHEYSCKEESCGFRENYKMFFQYKYPGGKTVFPNTPDYGLYYSYNYSNVHMIALDNFDNATYTEENGFTKGTFLTTNQLEWLREALSRNQNMWKFVYMHVPMYSTGDYGSNIELINQFEPIFEEYNVNAVFYGHDHHFESFYVNHTSGQGIYHFVIGTGGAGTDDLIDKEKMGDCAWSSITLNISNTEYNYNCFYGSEYQIYGEMTYAYIKVNVLGNQATFSVIRSVDGSEIIKFTQTK